MYKKFWSTVKICYEESTAKFVKKGISYIQGKNSSAENVSSESKKRLFLCLRLSFHSLLSQEYLSCRQIDLTETK